MLSDPFLESLGKTTRIIDFILSRIITTDMPKIKIHSGCPDPRTAFIAFSRVSNAPVTIPKIPKTPTAFVSACLIWSEIDVEIYFGKSTLVFKSSGKFIL